jgi:hypothetical protein
MLRLTLVACLLLVPTGGCASQRFALTQSAPAGPDERRSLWPTERQATDWLDDHPIVRGSVYGAGILALMAGVAFAAYWEAEHGCH